MPSTAFSAVLNNLANDRHFGGSTAIITADPYISGYHYIRFKDIPISLSKYTKIADGAIANLRTQDIEKMLSNSCISVSTPGGTINKTEFTGISGAKWKVPTTSDYGDSISIKFLEFSHLPIMSIISGWCRLIRDLKYGVATITPPDPKYTKVMYACSAFYWTTKPDGNTVEYSACYVGIYPTKDPQDSFSGDVATIDKLEIEVEFNVDWIWRETWVHNICQNYANELKNSPKDGYRGTTTIPRTGTDSSQS
jgi:hypothetical protein